MHASSTSTSLPHTVITRKVLSILAGVAVLTLSSHVQVPFLPVPMTLQTLAVLAIGAVMGARLGVATVTAWLAIGAAGLPVFATMAGPLSLVGPTAGFLFGFVIAAAFVGTLARSRLAQTAPGALVMFLIADVMIFASGAAWLATFTGLEQALATGVTPFLPAEALKIGLATALWLARTSHVAKE